MKSRLVPLMKRARYTYRALAQESGVDNSTLFRIASDDYDPRVSTIIAIIEALSARIKAPLSLYDLYPAAERRAESAARRLRATAPLPGEAADDPPLAGDRADTHGT